MPSGLHRPALDGLRGLAAFWVVVYHAWIRTGAGALDGLGPLAPVVRMGTLGVEVFFVLSGCVLVLRLLERPQTAALRPFVVRRLARLLPAVWVALAVAVATASWHQTSVAALERSLTPESILANATLLAGVARLVPGYDGAVGFAVDPVVWSLTPELLFSLILVPVLPAIVQRPWALLPGLLTAGVVLRGVDPSPQVLSVASPLLTAFPLGAVAALVLLRRPQTAARSAVLVLAGVVVIAGVIAAVPGTDASHLRAAVASHPVWPILVAGGCAACCVGLGRPADATDRSRWAAPARILGSRPLTAVGRWSYGIYLWHFPILGWLVWTVGVPPDGTNRSLLLVTLAATPLAILAGAASHRLIEQPARAWAARAVPARPDRSLLRQPPG